MNDDQKFAHLQGDENDGPTFKELSSRGVNKLAVDETPVIDAKFRQVTTCIDSLEKSVQVLLEKIEPVLAPNYPRPDGDETPQDTPEMSQVARGLDTIVDRILALDRVVNTATRRVEL